MTQAAALTVVFRTQSDIEAKVVRGLLEARGIRSMLSSALSHAVFPLSIDGLGEVKLSVRADQADQARQVIDDFRSGPTDEGAGWDAACAALEQRLGYVFRDKALLEHALTHRSRAHEDASGGVADNESMEFLGDAVLDLIIADRLFHGFPDYDEGRKSKAKAMLVAAPSLARLGAALGLGEYLLLGRGEQRSGGRNKPSLIADAYEAVVAAIYLDGGLAAEGFIDSQFCGALADLRAGRSVAGLVGDNKSALQEWLQARGRPLPEYRVAATSGPDHRKTFAVDVCVGDDGVARGEGPTKKAAEQAAAALALAQFAGTDSIAPGSEQDTAGPGSPENDDSGERPVGS